MKRYYHPQHGYHVAEGGQEAALEATGWNECGWEVKKESPEPQQREKLKLPKKE